jgi:sRNA-binding protein
LGGQGWSVSNHLGTDSNPHSPQQKEEKKRREREEKRRKRREGSKDQCAPSRRKSSPQQKEEKESKDRRKSLLGRMLRLFATLGEASYAPLLSELPHAVGVLPEAQRADQTTGVDRSDLL